MEDLVKIGDFLTECGINEYGSMKNILSSSQLKLLRSRICDVDFQVSEPPKPKPISKPDGLDHLLCAHNLEDRVKIGNFLTECGINEYGSMQNVLSSFQLKLLRSRFCDVDFQVPEPPKPKPYGDALDHLNYFIEKLNRLLEILQEI